MEIDGLTWAFNEREGLACVVVGVLKKGRRKVFANCMRGDWTQSAYSVELEKRDAPYPTRKTILLPLFFSLLDQRTDELEKNKDSGGECVRGISESR